MLLIADSDIKHATVAYAHAHVCMLSVTHSLHFAWMWIVRKSSRPMCLRSCEIDEMFEFGKLLLLFWIGRLRLHRHKKMLTKFCQANNKKMSNRMI